MPTEDKAWEVFEELNSSLAILIQTVPGEYHAIDLEEANWQDSPLFAGEFTFEFTDDGSSYFYGLNFQDAKITTVKQLEQLIEIQEKSNDAFKLFVENYPQDNKNKTIFDRFTDFYKGHFSTKEEYGKSSLKRYFTEHCDGFSELENYIIFNGKRYVEDRYGYLNYYESCEGGFHFFIA